MLLCLHMLLVHGYVYTVLLLHFSYITSIYKAQVEMYLPEYCTLHCLKQGM